MTVALNRRSLILAFARRFLGRPRARLRLGVGFRFCRCFGRGSAWLGGGLLAAARAAGIGAAAALVGALGALLFDQRHGAVEPDGEHVVARGEIGVGLAVLHVGPEAADAGDDRLAVVGMLADLARE